MTDDTVINPNIQNQRIFPHAWVHPTVITSANLHEEASDER